MKINRVEKTKLFRLLSALTPVELKGFDRFLQHSLTYKNPNIADLWNYIKNHYPDFTHSKLDKDTMLFRLFPERLDDPKFLTDRMSNLVLALEEFLVFNEVKRDKNLFNKIKIEVFRKKQLNKDFQFEVHKAVDKMEKLEARKVNWQHCIQLWEYHHSWYHQPVNVQYKIDPETIFRKAHENLSLFYLHMHLSYACEVLSMKKTFTENHGYQMPGGLLIEAKKHTITNSIIDIYYRLIQLYLAENKFEKEVFMQLVQLFHKAYSSFDKTEQRSFLLKLINLTNAQIEIGKDSFISICFDLFQFGIEKEILVIAGKITANTFTNICTMGALNGKFEWTDIFINDYAKTFPQADQESMEALGKAYVFIHQSKYTLASNELEKVHLGGLPEKLRKYSLQSRCLFEEFLDSRTTEQQLKSALEAFIQLLYRNRRLSKDKKVNYKNFIKGIRILIKVQKLADEGELKSRKKSKGKQHLQESKKLIKYRDQLEKLTPLISKKWLWAHFEKIAGK